MQSIILTEVSDNGLLIVVTSTTVLKRKDMLQEKKAVSPDHQNPQPSMYIKKCTVYTYTVYMYMTVYCALVDLNPSGSSGVRPTPVLTSSTQVVCVCVRAYTSTHPHTTLTPARIEKYTRQNPYFYPCQTIASHASNKR